jgi:TolA-binding protein
MAPTSAAGAVSATPSPGPDLSAPISTPPPPVTQQTPIVNRRGKPSAGVPLAAASAPDPIATVTAVPAAPPARDLFNTALSDYMAAKYTLASSEFGEVLRIYPQDNFAGTASYYQGEIDYRMGKYPAAIKDYDRVLEQFPDNPKVPVSHLHKGMALIEIKQRDAGIHEMQALITRFPASPEATQARTKLSGMGVPVTRQRP